MATYPEQLFESLDSTLLQNFIDQRQEENLHIDFKRANAILSRDDRKNLAVALSGFANADGGVIVWGVATARTNDGVEYASGIDSIAPLSQLVAQLNEFTGQGVNPLVDGVRHRKVEISSDAGVAITLVPSSDAGPHMAKLGEDRYYKRSGSRFAKMEHFEVADMFGRRQKPDLHVAYRLQGTDVGAPRGRITKIALRLENHGRGSAKAPLLEVTRPLNYSLNVYEGVRGGARQGEGLVRVVPVDALALVSRSVRFVGYGDFIIHPGTGYDIALLEPSSQMDVLTAVSIECATAAENARLTAVTLTITRDELLRAP